ncbi:orotidine-5'-phosphate decarboxylase [Tepidibacter thalassicus]|uniref:Orotidine 5'-phosphate decarboxylase n=1 Tax=Tepidibacter thalassicus DSM 15285 TaxID=1123350 RepID=A0A1M5SLC1_9FIRM|nr:orotidine-5'-phosphate decarboxylase [Tepidibacter thalassicus]SHH39344.1 orotidine-5'-phosphate decarboxylase [Tepidibacter thalassicus DSM 15285]
MIIDRLYEEVLKKGPICVGIDTRIEYIPNDILNDETTIEEKIFKFNKRIIDETHDLVACYKVQIACYEAFGIDGLKAYSKTLKYIKEKGNIVIGDIKRGDISSTAKMYAKAHFEGDFEVDFITVNPYMGYDAISPYCEYLEKGNKGLFVLAKTSNESSKDFQELEVDDEPLYMKVSKEIEKWGEKYVGKNGFSLIGSVVGCTNPKEIVDISNTCKNTFFLIPGYGAQGGKGKGLSALFKNNMCGVVNSSRGIITSYNPREAVLEMKEDILKWLR